MLGIKSKCNLPRVVGWVGKQRKNGIANAVLMKNSQNNCRFYIRTALALPVLIKNWYYRNRLIKTDNVVAGFTGPCPINQRRQCQSENGMHITGLTFKTVLRISG